METTTISFSKIGQEKKLSAEFIAETNRIVKASENRLKITRQFTPRELDVLSSLAITNIEELQFDYYQILKVEPNASKKEIKKSFRKLAAIFHPDKTSDLSQDVTNLAEEIFKLINLAHDFLTNENKRQFYDDLLAYENIMKILDEKFRTPDILMWSAQAVKRYFIEAVNNGDSYFICNTAMDTTHSVESSQIIAQAITSTFNQNQRELWTAEIVRGNPNEVAKDNQSPFRIKVMFKHILFQTTESG